MADVDRDLPTACLHGQTQFTAEPSTDALLLHRRGRTVRLDWERVREAYRVGGVDGLFFVVRTALRRDDQAELEELHRVLATSDGVVPVAVARRYAALVAQETRAACADDVWTRGMRHQQDTPGRPLLCQAGIALFKLRLPTDAEG